jgi:AraC family L-rhamnose operon regulatory protein RhaS
MRVQPAVFQGFNGVYHADTCEALRDAAGRGEVVIEALARGTYPGKRMPQGMLKTIRSVGFWDAAEKQSWGLDWHRNEGLEFTYLSRGKLTFATDDASFTLRRGHLTVTRPWQRHRVGNPHVAGGRLHWLILDVGVRRPHERWQWPEWLCLSAENLKQLTSLLQHNEQPVWRVDGEVEQCFERLAALVVSHRSQTLESRLRLHVSELLIAIMEMLQEQPILLDTSLTETRRSVEMFLKELRQHLEHPWTLPSMAQECGLARSQFAHYCRDITNMSPIEYLTHCRLEAARELLSEHPNMTITDVAFACGFGSSSYFSTVFRHHLGHPPQALRQRGAVVN